MWVRSQTPSLVVCGSLMFACGGDFEVSGAHWFEPVVEIGVGVPQNVVSAMTAGVVDSVTLNGAEVAGPIVCGGTTLLAVAVSV